MSYSLTRISLRILESNHVLGVAHGGKPARQYAMLTVAIIAKNEQMTASYTKLPGSHERNETLMPWVFMTSAQLPLFVPSPTPIDPYV